MKSQDYERLSAYVDDQLPPAEMAALDAQLARDADLRAALLELRMTVRTLRSLPVVKPPRSFTLTSTQVGQAQRRQALFPALRLAAVMSALALAVVVGGDLAARAGLLATAAPARDGATTNGPAPTSEQLVAQAPIPATITPEPSAEAKIESSAAISSATLPADGSGAADQSATTPAGFLAATLPTASGTPSSERIVVPTDTPAVKAMSGLEPTPTPEISTAAPPAATNAPIAVTAGPPPTEQPAGPPRLRLVEAALAMLVVMLGLGAWFTRNNS